MVTLFGTDGVRGVVNATLLPELAFQLGRAAGAYFSGEAGVHRFLVGRDTRISGTLIEAALASGLCASGIDVDIVGVIPTPGVAYLTRVKGYDAGVVISASHNPFPDNGIKFFDSNGFKLPDATEEKIEELLRHSDEIPRPTGEKVGVIRHVHDLADIYRNYVKSTAGTTLSGFRIITDSANGAASDYLPQILEELGAEVIATHREPNGVNINNNCGSTHIENLQKFVKEKGLDVGFAYDGDADRCLAVDENGNVVDGDLILYICGKYMKEQGLLRNNKIVTTVMSNLGLYKALDREEIGYEKTAVGDKYVYENMSRTGNCLGGEQSGHIIFSKYATTGDGILTSLKIMEVMLEKKETLGKLASEVTILPQLLKNVRVADKAAALNDPDVQAAGKAVDEALGNDGRLLLRQSGTEPLIRVMVEAETPEICEKYVDQVIDVLKKKGHVTEG